MKTNLPAKKQLLSISHKLQPTVTIAKRGLTEAVLAEIERALSDHELIKIRISIADRTQRADLVEEILEKTASTRISYIGKILVCLKKAPQPNPKLSNLERVV